MKTAVFWLLLFITIVSAVLIGVDGIYVGLFASTSELANYPWGTELGWAYIDKTNYMVAALFKAAIAWVPLILFVVIKHLTRSSSKDDLNRAV